MTTKKCTGKLSREEIRFNREAKALQKNLEKRKQQQKKREEARLKNQTETSNTVTTPVTD